MRADSMRGVVAAAHGAGMCIRCLIFGNCLLFCVFLVFADCLCPLLMYELTSIQPDATGLRIGIAVSRYHREITTSMRDAAVDAFVRSGGDAKNLTVMAASGTFELTAICRTLALMKTETGEPAHDAIVALGCVITGQTTHDTYIAHSVIQGLTAITVQIGVPIAFGVLTCQNLEQARARSVDALAAGGVNKGAEAMMAAIETARTLKTLDAGVKEQR